MSVAASSSRELARMRARSIATLPLPTTAALSEERSKLRLRKSGWALYQPTNSVAEWLPGRCSRGIPIRRSVRAPTA